MASCFDVAIYILESKGSMTAMKLQKLTYYSQAWSLVWDDAPLFSETIEAWINGPVIPELYEMHRGKYSVGAIDMIKGDARNLTSVQKETINKVLEFYGDKSSQWLSDLTHLEEPWKKARNGLPCDVRGNSEISLADMVEYYSSIPE